MSTEHQFKVGDKVRTTQRDPHFGDYRQGETAVIKALEGHDGFRVTWDERLFPDAKREASRLDLVFIEEIEPA